MEIVICLELCHEVAFFFNSFPVVVIRLVKFLHDFIELSDCVWSFLSKMRCALAYSKPLDCVYYYHIILDIWNLCLDLDESFEILAQGLFDLLRAIE